MAFVLSKFQLILRRIFAIQYAMPIIVVLFMVAAYYIPGGKEIEVMGIILTVVGILFAVIVGYFITGGWSRYEKVRENVAEEVSGLITYYSFAKVLGRFKRNKKWMEKQRDLIDAYVRKFVHVEWQNYEETNPEFQAIQDSLKDLAEFKTNLETETYSAGIAPTIGDISDTRERLIIIGKDKLSKASWAVSIGLSIALIFCLYYSNTNTLAASFFTGVLAAVVIMLLLILRDLNNLSKGEEIISFEPYQKVFDSIDKPRYYLRRDIEAGRVTLPKDIKYRLG